jgi:hypothetical protein
VQAGALNRGLTLHDIGPPGGARGSAENEKKKVQTRCLDQGKSSAPTWPSELFWVWILGWLAFGAAAGGLSLSPPIPITQNATRIN